ncbi:hypothetical protein EDD22DRAFT_848878 [Suillus occidentalis]|nr:hypothetical protein EDD22DRAFT_848878 [Suillus occidentalis]
MAQPEVTSMSDNTKAYWQDIEVDLLLQHLIYNQAVGGDGRNFTIPTFNSVATAINDSHAIQTISPPKTGKMVKTKWTLLKKIFNQIEIYYNVSGFHWDNVWGAGIKGIAAASVWDTYVDPKVIIVTLVEDDVFDTFDGGLNLLDMGPNLMMPPSTQLHGTSTTT